MVIPEYSRVLVLIFEKLCYSWQFVKRSAILCNNNISGASDERISLSNTIIVFRVWGIYFGEREEDGVVRKQEKGIIFTYVLICSNRTQITEQGVE